MEFISENLLRKYYLANQNFAFSEVKSEMN